MDLELESTNFMLLAQVGECIETQPSKQCAIYHQHSMPNALTKTDSKACAFESINTRAESLKLHLRVVG